MSGDEQSGGEQLDAPNKQAVGLDPPWVEGTGGGSSSRRAKQSRKKSESKSKPKSEPERKSDDEETKDE